MEKTNIFNQSENDNNVVADTNENERHHQNPLQQQQQEEDDDDDNNDNITSATSPEDLNNPYMNMIDVSKSIGEISVLSQSIAHIDPDQPMDEVSSLGNTYTRRSSVGNASTFHTNPSHPDYNEHDLMMRRRQQRFQQHQQYMRSRQRARRRQQQQRDHMRDDYPSRIYSNNTTNTAETDLGAINFRETVASMSGNILEWYDYAIFGFMSDIIGDVFFETPETDDQNNLVTWSFLVFGGAFVIRPVGGIVMGYVSDAMGRKKALSFSVFCMAFPTFLMALLPGYKRLGWISTLLLALTRLLQGFSVGGQFISSLIYTIEKSPRKQWGLQGSKVTASASFGILLGCIVAYIMRKVFSYEQLLDGAWRIPFFPGILIGFAGLYLKNFGSKDFSGRQIHSLEISALRIQSHSNSTITRSEDPRQAQNLRNTQNPMRTLFTTPIHAKSLLSAFLLSMLYATSFYTTFVWIPIYMSDIVEPPIPHAFIFNSINLLVCAVILFPLVGSLSDTYGRRYMMYAGAFGLMTFSPGLVYSIAIGDPMIAFFSQLALGFLHCLYGAPLMGWLPTQFPPHVRVTGISLAYDAGHTVFGGFSPAIVTVMSNMLGPQTPGLIYTIVAIFAIYGLYESPKYTPGLEYRLEDYSTYPETSEDNEGYDNGISNRRINDISGMDYNGVGEDIQMIDRRIGLEEQSVIEGALVER